jgi:hypothetical protein
LNDTIEDIAHNIITDEVLEQEDYEEQIVKISEKLANHDDFKISSKIS